MTSITAEVKFLVVLVFIRFCLFDLLMRCSVASRRASRLQPVCQWSNKGFCGFMGVICSPWLTGESGPSLDVGRLLDHEAAVLLRIVRCSLEATRQQDSQPRG